MVECDSSKKALPAHQPEGFCNHWFYSSHKWYLLDPNVDVSKSRGIFVTDGGSILVVDRGNDPARIISLVDVDKDGIADKAYIIAKKKGLNHGIAVHGDKLYASSLNQLFRWSYTDGQSSESTDLEVVITNMPSGGHYTRSLVFDKFGLLYLQLGSGGNIDSDAHDIEFRSTLRRFNLSSYSAFPIDYNAGEALAHGIRNEVGLSFDKYGNLWGVENSADKLNRKDLGGDVHKDNPSEELNLFPVETDIDGTLLSHDYGYPYCFTEYSIKPALGKGRNTVWAWPSTMSDGVHDDEWCRNHTKAPMLSMQAHSAPLGITFLDSEKTLDPSCPDFGAFPDAYHGDAFVAFHGSWNRDPPTGYKIVRIPVSSETGLPADSSPYDFFFNGESSCARWSSGWRPVDVKFDSCNRLLVSSDTVSGVLLITFSGNRSLAYNASNTIFSIDDPSCPSLTYMEFLLKHKTLMIQIVTIGVGGIILLVICCMMYIRYRRRKLSLREQIQSREYELINQVGTEAEI